MGACEASLPEAHFGRDALLFSGGEADRATGRITYPLNPERRGQLPWGAWWDVTPRRPQGPPDGRPRRR
jgi:hypothetical protein